jgi:hypothetical protein
MEAILLLVILFQIFQEIKQKTAIGVDYWVVKTDASGIIQWQNTLEEAIVITCIQFRSNYRWRIHLLVGRPNQAFRVIKLKKLEF